MGFFTNRNIPLWKKVIALPNDKQVTFGIIITTYGYIRSTCQDLVTETLNTILCQGIIDNSGKILLPSRVSDDQKQRLTNNLAVGFLHSAQNIIGDPSNKLKYISPNKLKSLLITPFLMDERHRSGNATSIDPSKCNYSKITEEARTQVLTSWMNILQISDPEFPKEVNLSGFLVRWNELCQAMVSGILIGASRTPDKRIIAKAKEECVHLPMHIQSFFDELAERMRDVNFYLLDKVEKTQNYSNNLDFKVTRDQGRDKVDLSRGGGGLIDILASFFYVTAEEILTTEEKKSFSIWANLPTSYWGDEHKKHFSIAQLHFLKEAETLKLNVPLKIIKAYKLIPLNDLPPLHKPLSNDVIGIFMKVYSNQLDSQGFEPGPKVTDLVENIIKNQPYSTKEPFLVNALDFKKNISSLSYGEYKDILVIGAGDHVVFYDTIKSSIEKSIIPHGDNNEISFAHLVLNDKYCLSASWEEEIRLWDLDKFNYVWNKKINCFSNKSVATSINRQEACFVDSIDTLYHINIKDGLIINEFTINDSSPEFVALAPSGLYAVTSGENVTKYGYKNVTLVWSLINGKIISQINCIKGAVYFLSISENDQCIIADSNNMMVWDIKNSILMREMKPLNKITCGAKATNSNFVVIGCENGTVEVWDWTKGIQKYCFYANVNKIASIAVSRDETTIYTGGIDKALHRWSTIGAHK